LHTDLFEILHSLGAYFHGKFLRDQRDLCLDISRTKSRKRSQVDSNNTDMKIFVPSNSSTTVNVNGMLESQQSSHTSEDNSLKRPLHKHTHSKIYIDDNSSVIPKKIDSSDLIVSNKYSSLDTSQHPEDSIEEWLIKNGVSISVFHPVTIDKISNCSCDVPRLASSHITTSVIHCQDTIPQTGKLYPSYDIARRKEPETHSINGDKVFWGGNGSRSRSIGDETVTKTKQTFLEIESISSVSVPLSLQDELHFNRSNFADRDDYPLRTDLLPGEILPSIDDALWAL